MKILSYGKVFSLLSLFIQKKILDKSTKILLSFSLHANISEIFSAGKSRPGQIGTIHCIRFFSICWVVFGHTFLSAMGSISKSISLFLCNAL